MLNTNILNLSKYEHDEILNLVVVVQFLKRKWQTYGFYFFLIHFIAFSILLIFLMAYEYFNKEINIVVFILGIALSLYFTLYELVQLKI